MMTNWMPQLEGRPGPKYLALAGAIADAVGAGQLTPGAKLPPMRNLAYDLGVTVGTVTRAYREAERRGLVEGEVGRGTFVKGDGRYPQPKAPRGFALGGNRENVINMSMAIPALGETGRYLAKTLAELGSEPQVLDDLMDYQAHSGLARHREAGAEWVRRAGIESSADAVTMTSGAQHAVLLALMALTRPGDTVVTECLTYPGLLHIAAQLDLKLVPVEIDREGLVPEALEKAIAEHRPRVVYMVPTIHNPTAAIMSEERRRRIAALLRRTDTLAIEDDVWGFVPENRPPALATFAPEHVIYATGLSKAMAPGLRVGYIVSPEGAVDSIRAVARLSNWMTPPLMAEVARRWIMSGIGDEMVAWQRGEARARLDLAAETFRGHKFRGYPDGYHIWLELPEPWRADAFRQEAEKKDVYVLSGESFVVGRAAPPHAVRVCVGACRTREEVQRGLDILKGILDGAPGAAAAVVA